MSRHDQARVRILRLAGAKDLPLPERSTPGSAGFDLRAHVDGPVEIGPGERTLVPTGVAVALPAGYEAQIRPRSGLALKEGLTLLNTPGTVDEDYRGEIRLIVINLGDKPVTVRRGSRVAQMIIQRVPQVSLEEVESLPSSRRGAGGFGHTGDR